jgi:nucleoside-diphosphate-sugar epimerase
MRHGYSRALVTGGLGSIGSYIVDRLLGIEIEVTAFDNLGTGSLEIIVAHEKNRDSRFIGDSAQGASDK